MSPLFKIFALLSVITASAVLAQRQNYCNVKSCPSKSQTMCKLPSDKPATRCRNYKSRTISQQEKQSMVKLHNKYRKLVAKGQEKRGNPGPQPAAVSMPDLAWDNELAKVAQRWALQCQFQHDQCRNVDRFKVGQNIAIKSTSGSTNSTKLDELVTMWYDEVKKVNGKNIVCCGSSDTGHYSQLVWAKTTLVGCGASWWRGNVLLVCNYGPAGNVEGQPFYKTSKKFWT